MCQCCRQTYVKAYTLKKWRRGQQYLEDTFDVPCGMQLPLLFRNSAIWRRIPLTSFDKLRAWDEGGFFPECCFPVELLFMFLSVWWEPDLEFFTFVVRFQGIVYMAF